MRPLSQIEVREVDRSAIDLFGLPGVVLMENAGRGCAEIIARHWVPGRAVICCGKGNNGGDGYVIARYLENLGWRVQVRLACSLDEVTGDAAVFLKVIGSGGLDCQQIRVEDSTAWARLRSELRMADLIVDALLGTGLSGSVRSPYLDWIKAINESERPVLAIDLPSGLDCNTGKPLGACVKATRTATMVAPKLGFENAAATQWTGPVDIVDIGIPQMLVQALVRRAPRPVSQVEE